MKNITTAGGDRSVPASTYAGGEGGIYVKYVMAQTPIRRGAGTRIRGNNITGASALRRFRCLSLFDLHHSNTFHLLPDGIPLHPWRKDLYPPKGCS